MIICVMAIKKICLIGVQHWCDSLRGPCKLWYISITSVYWRYSRFPVRAHVIWECAYTVYPIICAQAFVVLCFVVVISRVPWGYINIYNLFTHILRGYFTGTGYDYHSAREVTLTNMGINWSLPILNHNKMQQSTNHAYIVCTKCTVTPWGININLDIFSNSIYMIQCGAVITRSIFWQKSTKDTP